MKKILVTGAAGFIGSNICNNLCKSDYEVIGLDIYRPSNVGYKFYTLDLLTTQVGRVEDIFKRHQFDIIIHCAGPALVANSLLFLENDFKLTVLPTFTLLNAMRNECPECKFIYLSSAAVYGNPKTLPIKEEHEISPISPYGYHKLLAEDICKEFFSLYHLPIAIVRIFSAYGDGLKKQLLWDICVKAKQARDIELFGTGEETRDFIHIYDLVTIIKLIMETPTSDLQIYNVANGQQVKIKDLAQTLVTEYSQNNQIRFNGLRRPGDPLFWEADISKIKALGYHQQISILEGIKSYVKWFSQI